MLTKVLGPSEDILASRRPFKIACAVFCLDLCYRLGFIVPSHALRLLLRSTRRKTGTFRLLCFQPILFNCAQKVKQENIPRRKVASFIQQYNFTTSLFLWLRIVFHLLLRHHQIYIWEYIYYWRIYLYRHKCVDLRIYLYPNLN